MSAPSVRWRGINRVFIALWTLSVPLWLRCTGAAGIYLHLTFITSPPGWSGRRDAAKGGARPEMSVQRGETYRILFVQTKRMWAASQAISPTPTAAASQRVSMKPSRGITATTMYSASILTT